MILADDAVLFREGVARLLGDLGVVVIAQVGDADALLAAAAADPPDAAVVDIRMPPTHTSEGLRAAASLRRSHPRMAVLVLSQYVEARHAVDLFGTTPGGVGYLLKERVTEPVLLADALQRLVRGESVLDAEVVAMLVGRRRRNDTLAALSGRELEILGLMAEGRSNRGIGETLHVSGHTVESHIRSIFTKLDLVEAPDDHRRVLAVLQYLGR